MTEHNIEKKAKRLGLPSLKDLDLEFDIGEVTELNYLKKTAEKITEKIEKYRQYLEEFVNVDGNSYAALMEIKNLNERQKDKILHLHKELIMMERDFLIADLTNSEKSLVEYIKQSLSAWNKMKDSIKEIVLINRNAWELTQPKEERLGYLG